jgi:AraC-like DNA-binding protein
VAIASARENGSARQISWLNPSARYARRMASTTVSSRFVAKLLDGLCVLGGDRQALLATAGLTPQLLENLDGRVEHALMLALFGAAEQQLGEVAIGLRLAEMVRRLPDNVLRIAIQSSADVGEAFARVIRYSRLVHEGVELRLIEQGDVARLRHRNVHGEHRIGVELSLGLAVTFMRGATLGAFQPDAADFAHRAPPSLEEHQRFFAVPVRFGQPHNELTFPRRALELPLREADPSLASHLDRHLDVVLATLGKSPSFVETVRRAVGVDLRGGLPRMDEIARRLHMSERTLQRRLRQAGTSFQEVLAEVRREISVRYLRETEMSLAEVAFIVGFSEVSTFHRAFKQWTGATPASCRRAAG